MMTPSECEELFQEFCKPYSDEEFDYHLRERLLKSNLEVEHAYNFHAITVVGEWLDYVGGHTDVVPANKVWLLIRPCDNIVNDHSVRLKAIFAAFAEHGLRRCPQPPILVFCSRSSITLLDRLSRLHDTDSLAEARDLMLRLFALVNNANQRTLSDEEFRNLLASMTEAFIGRMADYARELGDHLRGLVDARARTAGDQPATKGDVSAAVTAVSGGLERTNRSVERAKREIATVIRQATSGTDRGCHHPNKQHDAYVQNVIKHLARPGVTFSIHNACIAIGGRSRTSRACRLTWLYDWCNQHRNEILGQVEIIRATSAFK